MAVKREDPFKVLVQAIVDYAIYMLDPCGIVTSWNAGAERIKGYRGDEIIGRHFSTFYPDDAVASGLCDRELEMDRERLNPNGGGIALGHPTGCSGARIVVGLLHELERRGGRYGIATLCVSGGMGMAMGIELC